METSYKVRIFNLQTRKNKAGEVTSYRVRWRVESEEFGESFKTYTLADAFRAKLLTASKDGQAFNVKTGLPVTMGRKAKSTDFLSAAQKYIDMKWPDSAPKYRKSLCGSMTDITVAMLKKDGEVTVTEARKSVGLLLNPKLREQVNPAIVRSLTRAIRPVSDLADAETLRGLLWSLDLKLDGSRASSNTTRIKRVALRNFVDYAIEEEWLDGNPLATVKTKKRRFELRQVDPGAVVNTMQGRMLLDAVQEAGKPGPPLVAFFGLMYYAAMRPEEAANVKKGDLSLPEQGWGDIHLKGARPEIGAEWTDSGEASEEGPLKHREEGIGRTVPCPPPLTEILHRHLNTFGTARDGRLFRGARDGGRVGSTVYGRVWARAREAVFTPEVLAGPLARRPYDLRHAAVSTWLNSGVEATRVAKWAGHSLAVLLRVYAKCLDGGEQAARDRVERGLLGW